MFTPAVLPDHVPDGEALWFAVRDGHVLLDPEAPEGIPRSVSAPVEPFTRHVLGVRDGVAVHALDVPSDAETLTGEWTALRSVYGQVPDDLWVLAGRAVQVVTWDRDHRHCGRCGTPTDPHTSDRARTCPSCGLMAFPRLTPAVIMLVRRDDRVLLAHGRQFPSRFYSALAGFVEPGETLEEAVVREVREEVGLEVDDVRYYGSQPWPFPHSLMIGFTARWVSGEIEIDPNEIVDADWYHRDDLPPSPIGGMSIAGWLIRAWLDGELDTGDPPGTAPALADVLDDDETDGGPSGGSIWGRLGKGG